MARDLPDTVLVGRVIRPHGLRGDVVVEPLSDVDGRFSAGASVLFTRQGTRFESRRIVRSGHHKDRLLVGFEAVGDRNAAEDLRGVELYVAMEAVPGAPDDEFYFFELIGCTCVDRADGELGEVRSVIEDGGGVLLEVERHGRRLLVPFVRSFVVSIDVEAGRIDLELPPGLRETCASTS